MKSIPKYHVPFCDEWTTWKWIGLRGTGFPVRLVRRLSMPACAAAADRLTRAETALQEALDAGCDAARRGLDELERSEATQPRRKLLLKSLEKLKKGKVHAKAPEVLDPALLDAVRTAQAEQRDATAAFAQAYAQASTEQGQAINEIAADPRFQEAVLWQNHNAYKTALLKLPGSDPSDTSSSRRQKEELVAKYIQRYTVKNDTIGFFGPVGWAIWSETEQPSVRVEPGPDLLADRNVYFEGWPILALSQVLMSIPGVLPWLKPQTLPLQWLGEDGEGLYRALGLTLAVDADQIRLLEAADGARTAQQLCQDLAADPECGYDQPQQVMQQLLVFRQEGAIAWEFFLPPGPHTLQVVRAQVDEFGDSQVRNACYDKINALDGARKAVAEAAGNTEALEKAIDDMNRTFASLTGVDPTRSGGQLYAARTLIYEDCKRDGVVELGPEIRRCIAEPLAPILYSVRWLTSQVAAAMRQVLDILYRELAPIHGPEIPLLVFWPPMSVSIMDANINSFTNEALDGFAEKWREILGLERGQVDQEVRWTSEELWPKVRAAFSAKDGSSERPGWEQARYNSPDVMIAADSVEALRAGDFFSVLGEVHITFPSLAAWLFGAQHPDLDALVEVLESDLRESRVLFDEPHVSTVLNRFGQIVLPKRDYVLRNLQRASTTPPEQRLEPEDVVMVRDEQGVMRLRSKSEPKIDLDFLAAMALHLTYGVVTRCKLLPASDHWPRVWIDSMVVNRQSWVFDGREMDFVHASTPADRFAGTRAWWRRHGLPERVFLRVATEQKPTYVDFGSPVYVELFAKSVRAVLESGLDPSVRMAEMLPDLHQAWLPDAEGNRYTSELRTIILDNIGSQDHAGPAEEEET